MDDEQAADYAETLPELCKALLLKASGDRWTRTDTFFDPLDHPFTSRLQVVRYLEGSNLVDVQQGRTGRRFDCLIVRLNERGIALKEYLTRVGDRK